MRTTSGVPRPSCRRPLLPTHAPRPATAMMSQRGDAVSGGSSGGGVSWYAWRYAGDAPGLGVDLGRFGAVRNSHRCSLGMSMFDACASQPPPQRPATFAYNCDSIGVLQDMTWMSRDSDGARGTGTDGAPECQPNCAQGTRLFDPIVVHAWNPLARRVPRARRTFGSTPT